MNAQSGRSAGIALLLAAGLLALLFAFGVFSPQATPGVSADPCTTPDDEHKDNADPGVACSDAAHEGTQNHMINGLEDEYTFSIDERTKGSGQVVAKVMASFPSGDDVTYQLSAAEDGGSPQRFLTIAVTGVGTTATAAPTRAADDYLQIYPDGSIVYKEAGTTAERNGLNWETILPTSGVASTTPKVITAYIVASPPTSTPTATPFIAKLTINVSDVEADPPTGLMVKPVTMRDADATVVPAIVAISESDAREMLSVEWTKHPLVPSGTPQAYTVEYRKKMDGQADEANWGRSGIKPYNDTTAADLDDISDAQNKVIITGLDAKTDYEVRVRVVNAIPDVKDDETSAPVDGETISRPTDDDKVMITVTSDGQDSGELMVSWTKTDGMELGDHEVGGDSTGGYVVQYGERQTWSVTSDPTLLSRRVTGSSTTLTRLNNGTTYYVRVLPTNRAYSQAMAEMTPVAVSNTATGTPYGMPSAPRNLQVVGVDQNSLLATWSAPMDMGGYASVGYKIMYKVAGSTADYMEMDVSATSANISNLTAGTLYQVKVMATNAKGSSPAAVGYARTAAGPAAATAPGLVRDIGVRTISDTVLFVSWSPPASNGGSDITGYSVQYRVIGTTDWMTVSRTGTGVGQSITGLTAGTSYQVQVAAVNSVGTSAYAQGTGRTNAAPAAVTTLDNDLPKTFEAVSSDTPGDAVRVTLKAKLAVALDGEITVKLDKFGLPDSIDTDEVTIRSNDGTLHYQGNPISVTTSESDVTLTLGTLKGLTDSSKTLIDLEGDKVTTITIQQSAGITNPTAAKVYALEVGANATTNKATINRKVSVDPTSGARGSEITVTGKGFGAGTATIELGTGKVLASNVAIEDGSFEHTLTVGDDFAAGANTINAVDGAGDRASKDNDADFTVKPKVTADPEEAAPTEEITIKVSDWSAGAVTSVTFGGLKATIKAGSNTTSSGSKGELKITVPANARVGVNKVSLNVGKDSKGSVNVTVKSLGLTVDPDTAVPGQRLTITGSGFVKNTDVTSITVGGKEAELPDEDDRASTSTGRIAYTITVPLDVGDGDHKVVVTVGAKMGIGAVAVPKPSITVSPEVSAPGTVISVEGTGFASGERIEVLYDGEIEEVGRADSSGEFTIRMDVPSDAGIGTTNDVKVEVRGDESINATAEHKTPGSMITLPETAQVGTRITVSGSNFEPFTALREVLIGGTDALPSPAPETDKNGAFSFEVRVPRLTPGNHTVTVKDGSRARNSATETFAVVTTPVVSAPEEVFGVLGDKLVVVWRYHNATATWASYSPGAPAELNDLTGVSRGDIVWIQVTADVEFQGRTLYLGTTGWNLITLE